MAQPNERTIHPGAIPLVVGAGAIGLGILWDLPRWVLLGMLALGTAVGLWALVTARVQRSREVRRLSEGVSALAREVGGPDPDASFEGSIDALGSAVGAARAQREGWGREESVLVAAIDALEWPILATDAGGAVRLMNASAASWLGVRPERVLGRPIDAATTYAELLRLHARASGGVSVRERVRLTRPDGVRVVDVLARPVELGGAGAGGLVVLALNDVTDQARAEQVRADFVANASHELRTPIAAMRVAADTLESLADEEDGEEGRVARARFLKVLSANVERLEELVRDLLDLSRLEAPDAPADLGIVDLAQVRSTLSATFDRACAERRLRLVWEVDPGAQRLRSDRKLLLLILQNLIDNATKFAHEGTDVRVVIRAVPAVAAGRQGVRVEVIDRGLGIPLEQQGRIFERFYQVDAARTGVGSARRGTGLGLAIVKNAVKRLGGSIQVRSVWKEGTTMIVELPGCVEGPAASSAVGVA